MIAKERKVPLKLLDLESILNRLPPNYPKRALIEKDFRLNVNDTYFQINTFLLSNKFALILEIKNIAGKLVFDPVFKQLTRIYQEKETGLLDPITQTKRQQRGSILPHS